MRALILVAILLSAPALAQKPSSESTPSPEKLLAELGMGVSDEEVARAVAEASVHPLGTLANPIRVGGPHGERAYIARLRCADGSAPAVGQRGSGGVGAFGTIVDLYPLDCKGSAPGKVELVMDMYHDGHVETAAPAGFTFPPLTPMIRFLKGLGTAPLFLVIALCWAPTLVMPFLDFRYYREPVSDHFDGERFFNSFTPPGYKRPGADFFLGRVGDEERATWPDHVPVTPTVPPARVDGNEMKVTWIGHATVLIQSGGLNILTDPIWSERASPVSFLGPKRVRAPGVRFDDLPKIDLVLISHNHYDHMDLPTLKRLWARDRPVVVTSLGNDRILKTAGVEAAGLDWNNRLTLPSGASVTVQPNHHWSSRWMVDRNRALWSAFSVTLPGGNIFFAGDTGFGDGGWAREAAKHGPYRLAILPVGAYAPQAVMENNHLDPDEAMAVYRMLGARSGLGMHWGTFQLTFEPIDEPVQRLNALRAKGGAEVQGFVASEVGRTWDVPTL